MTSIGPEIPAHLQRGAARRPEDDEDDEEIGPSLPQAKPQASNNDNVEEDDEMYGPALPPHLKAAKGKGKGSSQRTEKSSGTSPKSHAQPRRRMSVSPPRVVGTKRATRPSPSPPRVVGPKKPAHRPSPSPPRVVGSSRPRVGPTFPSASAVYDDDDDDYGPKPLPPAYSQYAEADGLNEGVREFIEREERRKKNLEDAAKPKALQREEWMLKPPEEGHFLGALADPLKLKARQFSAATGRDSGPKVSNLWTETPAERQQRLADEVAGKKRRATAAPDPLEIDEDVIRKRRRDEEIRKAVDEHTKSSRGASLLDVHSSNTKEKDEKDAAIWDHSRDMALGGRLMDEKQRGKMISDSKGLGSRFSAGKTGGYL